MHFRMQSKNTTHPPEQDNLRVFANANPIAWYLLSLEPANLFLVVQQGSIIFLVIKYSRILQNLAILTQSHLSWTPKWRRKPNTSYFFLVLPSGNLYSSLLVRCFTFFQTGDFPVRKSQTVSSPINMFLTLRITTMGLPIYPGKYPKITVKWM